MSVLSMVMILLLLFELIVIVVAVVSDGVTLDGRDSGCDTGKTQMH